MSGWGQKETSAGVVVMSAPTPKADIGLRSMPLLDVWFLVPLR